jgi:hypothetical protein
MSEDDSNHSLPAFLRHYVYLSKQYYMGAGELFRSMCVLETDLGYEVDATRIRLLMHYY